MKTKTKTILIVLASLFVLGGFGSLLDDSDAPKTNSQDVLPAQKEQKKESAKVKEENALKSRDPVEKTSEKPHKQAAPQKISPAQPSTPAKESPTAKPQSRSSVTVAPQAVTPKPAPRPTPVPAPTPKPAPTPSVAYYKNCTAVRAAGAAPLYAGQPGYAKHLDRDGDGIACE